MHWTTEKPTQPGFYWLRYVGETRYQLQEVVWTHGGPPKYPSDELRITHSWRRVKDMETSEWCAVTVELPPP